MKRALNLYSGIGGNRKLWEGIHVTAVEIDKQTAEIYKDLFPKDEVVVADAHQYLIDHGYFEPKEKALIRMQQGNAIFEFERIFGFDLSKYKVSDKRKKLRNCVHPETGKYILDLAMNILNKPKSGII
jgi:site-specific DNA-cytosine methylase